MATTPVGTNVEVGSPVTDGGLDFGSIVPMVLEKFIQVVEATVIVVLSVFAIRMLRKKLQKIETIHLEQRTALNLIEKISTGFIIVIAVTLALKTVGIDITLLVSVAVLGLSYGLQDIIKNYVAGILILFKAPFKIDDIVKIRDFTGRVVKMDFQSTTLETFDHRSITIYNSDVMTQSIVNFTKSNIRRMEIHAMVGYGSDVPKALEIFEKILMAHPSVLKSPKYSVVFRKFTATGPVFAIKFWLQRPCNLLKIQTEIATRINQAFDEEKILGPYSKGIETADETTFSQITEDRKKRVQEFYSMPMFGATPVLEEAQIQQGVENVQENIQDEEPEA